MPPSEGKVDGVDHVFATCHSLDDSRRQSLINPLDVDTVKLLLMSTSAINDVEQH